jgi:hypothetical protein
MVLQLKINNKLFIRNSMRTKIMISKTKERIWSTLKTCPTTLSSNYFKTNKPPKIMIRMKLSRSQRPSIKGKK